MNHKILYMIGNSHIDPVWFWNWDEGMQEVKATFASALERMNEFEQFHFTCTSTAYLEWIQKICPDMFVEIQKRVKEGRWEITGGWFIEPDCLLPSGESFARQSLYGQRFLAKNFGKICEIGSNVDSFGHAATLPQILRKSGMQYYVFMRPRIDEPVFRWISADGSEVTALCLPGEYTTWFHEATVNNIRRTIDATPENGKMACCYGVGNHGGGPTIENIQSIESLKNAFDHTELRFSTYSDFFQDIQQENIIAKSEQFEKINVGCYSIDSELKRLNRLAEKRLIHADTLLSMSRMLGNEWLPEVKNIECLWKNVLFNTFHDIMGGTIIKSATQEAQMQVGAACAGAMKISVLAMQAIANRLDNRGEGTPIILFNPTSHPYDGIMEVELEWFCKSPLRLTDPEGKEIPYQRIHTDAKVRHTNLAGRRRVLFPASVPAFGYAVYRAFPQSDSLGENQNMEIRDTNACYLENDYLRAEFDTETGMLTSLLDKQTGYQAVTHGMSIPVYQDERDCWGGLQQGRRFERIKADWRLISMEKVESGSLRSTIRIRLCWEQTRLELLFSLSKTDRALHLEGRLLFAHMWKMMKLGFGVPSNCSVTEAEIPYGTYLRKISDEDVTEYNMHRFVDVRNEAGQGLFIANDCKYAFNMENRILGLTLARSAIIAQGNGGDWFDEKENYEYTDQGMQTFHLALRPHGSKMIKSEMYREAAEIEGQILYLADNAHPGDLLSRKRGLLTVDAENVEIAVIKKAEEGNELIIRFLETEGRDTQYTLDFGGHIYRMSIGHNEIKTVIVHSDGGMEAVNLIEQRMSSK